MMTCGKLLPRFLMGFIPAIVLCGAFMTFAEEAPPPESSPPVIESAPVPSTESEAGEVHDRGVIRDHRGKPGLLPPPKTGPGQVNPKLTVPAETGARIGTLALPDRYTAPTTNLTMVANALTLRHKSLTTLVTAAPNLPLTQPVEISIGFYSPAGTQRITQSYVRSTGNRFLYNDREGDGKPRRARVDITLSEPKAGGGVTTFALPWQADLDPLYDVSISPFQFDLISNCDFFGKSEITFEWLSPDDQRHAFKFSSRGGRRTTINGFNWSRAEVSALHNLHRPTFLFIERDPQLFHFPGLHLIGGNLVPGTTQLVKGNKNALDDSNCSSYYEYTTTYTLRWYAEP